MTIYKLKDISNIKIGKDMPGIFSILKNNENNVPIVSNGVGDSQIVGYTNIYSASRNSVSISARGTVGHVSYWEVPIYPIVRLIVIEPNAKYVIPKYLFLRLNKMDFEFSGAVQKQITKPMIMDKEVDIPSLSDQQKIIDIIEPLELLIKNYERKFCVLEKIIFKLIENRNNKFDNFANITKYSKLINSKNLIENGKFFYTTGKTISNKKMTDDYNFENGISIAYEGAGIVEGDKLCPMHHDEKVYIARKWGIESEYSLTLFYTLKNTNSNGVIENGVKMPNLSKESINSLSVPDCNFELENKIKSIHNLKTELKNQIILCRNLIQKYFNNMINEK